MEIFNGKYQDVAYIENRKIIIKYQKSTFNKPVTSSEIKNPGSGVVQNPQLESYD